MRKILPTFAVFGLFLAASLTVLAAEEKTITGTAECAKCTRKETKTCQAAVKVKEGDKEVVYYLKHNDVAKKIHADTICTPNSSAKYKVTGDLTEKDGKKIIEPKKIDVITD